ncbi:hypothetical protein TNCV_2511521 [Trichonephila clavipes]|nr:hypothetical protein TNCV_2511521 [Trichonephila clavipes]
MFLPQRSPLGAYVYGKPRPSAALLGTSSRRDETTLARLHNGHTQAQWHEVGLKIYPPCRNCNVTQAASVHILACIDCRENQRLSNPATALHCLKLHEFMG